MMGGTAVDGAKAFANVASELKRADIGEQLARLGITSDEQREHTLKYMAQQTRMGLALNKSQADQIAGAKVYMEELDKTASLLGVSREEQEKQRDALLAEEQFRAAVFRAEQENDQGKLNQLKQYFELANKASNAGDKKGATGILRYSALGGPTDEMSAAAMQTYGRGFDAIRRGVKDDMEIYKEAVLGSKQQMSNMALTKQAGGEIGSMVTGQFGTMADQLKNVEAADALAKKQGISFGKALENILKDKQAKPEAQLAANVSADRIQQAAAMLQDSVVKHFDQSAIINERASKLFESAVDTFGGIVGVKKPEGGTPQVGKRVIGASNITKPLADKHDALVKQAEEADKAVIAARRSGETQEKIEQLKHAALKTEEERSKIATELVEQDKKASELGRQAAAARQKQRRDKGELDQLEKANKRDTSKLGDLNEKKADLKGKPTPAIDKEIKETQSGITDRTEKINALKSSLETVPQSSGRAASELISYQGDRFGNKEHYLGLDSAVRENFEKMVAEYGKPVQINSASRSFDEQKSLYDKWINSGKSGNPVAKPGHSKHESGRALDLSPAQVSDLKQLGLLDKYGFGTISGDPPHIQMARHGGLFDGPSSGYQVELHGREAVVPMPNPNAMLASNDSQSVQKDPLSSVMKPEPVQANNDNGVLMELFQMLSSKMDTLSDHMASGNDTREELLKYSRV